MMNIISKTICLSSVFSLVYPMASFASLTSAYASLVDTSQNQTFESRPQAAASLKRPVSSSFIKLAAVHFITNDNSLNFGNQEFLPGDLCKQGGYTHNGCPSGYLKGEECPYDSKYVKECISPDSWCKSNGYKVSSCTVPNYPANPCPYLSSLYKSCEVDNIRACKEAGYSLTCEAGKIGDTAQACPYNSSYKKCICNPCSGYTYTAAQASAQGYTPGEVCNSCGTIKYKRMENKCEGYQTCDCGGETSAKICYSGSVKKFDTCKTCCDAKYQYDSSNCSGDKQLTGNSCGGKYDTCIKSGLILYADHTTSRQYLPEKIAIGVVFDEVNRLAAAINNIGYNTVKVTECVKSSSLPAEQSKLRCTYIYSNANKTWGSHADDIPDLKNCEENDLNCASDGQVNTKTILAFGKTHGYHYDAADYANNYKPAKGCASGSWCGAGNWFLPSMRDLTNFHTNKETTKNTLKMIPGAEAIVFDDYKCVYASSNERLVNGYSTSWSYKMDGAYWYDGKGWSFGPKNFSADFVLPIIKY